MSAEVDIGSMMQTGSNLGVTGVLAYFFIQNTMQNSKILQNVDKTLQEVIALFKQEAARNVAVEAKLEIMRQNLEDLKRAKAI